jgi:hypothetical protein
MFTSWSLSGEEANHATQRRERSGKAASEDEMANPRVEASADSAVDLPLEFLLCMGHSSAVPHAFRSAATHIYEHSKH